jgi:hypothetical protein
LPRPSQELHETHDGDERISVVIIVIDDIHEIVIATALILCDLVAIMHGDCYVVNSDIRLRSRNFYVQVLINR